LGGEQEGKLRMGREWMRSLERVVEKENNGLYPRRRRESEGGESRDEKIVMVKLIVQKENKKKKLNTHNNVTNKQTKNPPGSETIEFQS
jgi:hypothetical protein